MKKLPSFSQWKQIFKVLKRGEKITLAVLLILAVTSLAFLLTSLYFSNTRISSALGGTYTEGIVGQPRFINPIYGETNDIDRSLIDVMFSGLMTYDNQGAIVEDLTKTYTVSPDGRIYDITIKDNAIWHDGKALTVDDVIFTIKTIQNSDYRSPLRANWTGVDVQKVSDLTVRFTLKTAYNSFLENLTVKIIPKHIWETISPENFAISSYNLQPIGSGPFQFLQLDQTAAGFIKTLSLTSNRRYYHQASFVENVSFQFFERKEDMIRAVNAGQIQGFTLAALDNNQAVAEKEINQGWLNNSHFSVYSFLLPRYFAVFFNPSPSGKPGLLTDVNIRQALSHAVNKNELVEKINAATKNNTNIVDSPILADFFGYETVPNAYDFNQEQAKKLLDKVGFLAKGESASGGKDIIREKAITKKAAFQFTSYLKIGSKGKQVTQLQTCLAKLDESFKNMLASEINGTFGKPTDQAVTAFQQKYLPEAKPTGETGTGTRAKLNELCAAPSSNTEPLQFTLTTINQPQLVEVANALKEYWRAVGVQVTVQPLSVTDIKPIIKARNYDALLYGEALGAEPDLYPFWHSSQKVDPGLNLAGYENKKADQLLKEARETIDRDLKAQKYNQLQSIILSDAPALFLYNPDYIYWVSTTVQGVDTTPFDTAQGMKIIDPAKRFININNWFIQTKRIWK